MPPAPRYTLDHVLGTTRLAIVSQRDPEVMTKLGIATLVVSIPGLFGLALVAQSFIRRLLAPPSTGFLGPLRDTFRLGGAILDSGPEIFVGVIWTLAFALIMYHFLWQAFGREVVEVDGRTLRLRRSILAWVRRSEFPVEEVRRLRVVPRGGERYTLPALLGGGEAPPGSDLTVNAPRLAFDHGGRSIRFAVGLEDDEAERILAALLARHPGLGGG